MFKRFLVINYRVRGTWKGSHRGPGATRKGDSDKIRSQTKSSINNIDYNGWVRAKKKKKGTISVIGYILVGSRLCVYSYGCDLEIMKMEINLNLQYTKKEQIKFFRLSLFKYLQKSLVF